MFFISMGQVGGEGFMVAWSIFESRQKVQVKLTSIYVSNNGNGLTRI